jgi:hypothetical protein
VQPVKAGKLALAAAKREPHEGSDFAGRQSELSQATKHTPRLQRVPAARAGASRRLISGRWTRAAHDTLPAAALLKALAKKASAS